MALHLSNETNKRLDAILDVGPFRGDSVAIVPSHPSYSSALSDRAEPVLYPLPGARAAPAWIASRLRTTSGLRARAKPHSVAMPNSGT